MPRACAVAALVAASCQSYEPRPLEPDAHRAAWHGRTLEAFVEELERNADAEPAGFDPRDFDPGDGLTLAEGELFALVFNPALRLERLRAARAAASADNAGLWPDPSLSFSAVRILENVPDRWVVNPSLTVQLPTSGRLGAERDRADAALRAAELGVLEEEWAVRRAVRLAWTEWTAAGLRVRETERFVDDTASLVDTAERLAEAGEMPRTESTLFAMERARRRNDLARLRGELAASEQRLRSRLGLSPDAPVDLVPALGAAADEGPDDVTAALVERNPTLVRLRADYDVAEETLRREIRGQFPDLTLGPSYAIEEGQNRFGVQGGLPIPLWNRNRRAIAEARVDRDLARAAFETEYELLVGRQAAARADLVARAAQRRELEDVLVPLVDGQLEDALRLLRLGEGTSLVLLASLTRSLETRLDLIDARRAEAVARTEVDYAIGPPVADEALPMETDR